MEKEIRIIHLNTDRNTVKVVNMVDDLDHIYEKLNCDTFDVARRAIGGKRYDILVDDIGLWADKPVVSALNPSSRYDYLVGNLVICNHDEEGNLASLTDEDIRRISKSIGMYYDGTVGRYVIEIGV